MSKSSLFLPIFRVTSKPLSVRTLTNTFSPSLTLSCTCTLGTHTNTQTHNHTNTHHIAHNITDHLTLEPLPPLPYSTLFVSLAHYIRAHTFLYLCYFISFISLRLSLLHFYLRFFSTILYSFGRCVYQAIEFNSKRSPSIPPFIDR